MAEHDLRPECNRRFETLESKVDDITVIKEAIVQIKEHIAYAKEDSDKRDAREEKRDERDEELTRAINNINMNLTELNKDNHETKKRVGDVEIALKEQTEKLTVNWADVIKKALTNFLVLGVGAGLMYLFTTIVK